MHTIDRNINILVVDDFSTMRRIVKNLLVELGFSNLDEADDGSTAWPMIQTGKYDFIISDWNMPEMTGLELLKKVRSTDPFKNMPFMLITAEQKRSQILHAAEAGVDGYIVKPFTAHTLQEKINKIADRKALTKMTGSPTATAPKPATPRVATPKATTARPLANKSANYAAEQKRKMQQMLASMTPEKRAAYIAKLKRSQHTK